MSLVNCFSQTNQNGIYVESFHIVNSLNSLRSNVQKTDRLCEVSVFISSVVANAVLLKQSVSRSRLERFIADFTYKKRCNLKQRNVNLIIHENLSVFFFVACSLSNTLAVTLEKASKSLSLDVQICNECTLGLLDPRHKRYLSSF